MLMAGEVRDAGHTSPTRSLDRLKSLDKYSDIQEGIREGLTLCNHALKADMLIRWVSGKLAKDKRYSLEPASWELLEKCVRLLSPSLLASRLKGSSLIHIMTTSLSDTRDMHNLLRMESVLSTLMAISETHTALKSVLAVDSESSALFFAAYAHAILQNHEALEHRISRISATGLRIWESRRLAVSMDDNKCFAEHCWIPAALLINRLQRHGRLQQSTKRGSDEQERVDQAFQVKYLERLIAKHVFVPSRASYFKKRSVSTGEDSPTAVLDAQIQQFAISLSTLQQDALIEIATTSFGIATRCSTVTSQRQLLQEKAWNDAVLLAMMENLSKQDQNHSTTAILLLRLLEMVRDSDILSTQVLQQSIRTYGGMGRDTHSEWLLLLKIVAIDPRVFEDEELATQLFDSITSSYQEDDSHIETQMLKERIILPILHVYAQDRKLLDFVRLHQQQLQQVSKLDTIWSQLDDELATLLEQFLTRQQIVDEFKTSAATLMQAYQERDSKTKQLIHAKSHTLSIIVYGIREPATEAALLPLATDLLEKLETSKIHEFDDIWLLVQRLYDLCSPQWHIKSAAVPVILYRDAIFDSNLFRSALKHARSKTVERQSAFDALLFVGNVCSVYAGDQVLSPRTIAIMHEVIEHSPVHAAALILTNFDLWASVSTPDRAILSQAIGSGHDDLQHAFEEFTTPRRVKKSKTEAKAVSSATPANISVQNFANACQDIGVRILNLAQEANQILSTTCTPKDRATIRTAYEAAVSTQDSDDRIEVIRILLRHDEKITSSTLVKLQVILDTLPKASLTTNQHESLVAMIMHIVELTRQSQGLLISVAHLQCLNHILRHNFHLVNQYMAEELLALIQELSKSSKVEVLVFPQLCDILTALLKHHRARLNGRFHILIPTLQSLLASLLTTPRSHEKRILLDERHARMFTRMLSMLCDPPQIKYRQKGAEETSLVDQARRTRATVGSFVPPLLHSYCVLLLKSTPRSGIREALTPALWTIFDAMEVNDVDSIKVLSSAMNNNERSILRSIVDEWRSSSRWTGR